MSKRRMLVTSALPYANGSLHLGHMVEHVQTDIWVRFQRLRGHHVIYVCGEDAHGTPIMISAEKQGITPEQLIGEVAKEHKQDFDDFGIAFDNYYTTHSPENKRFAELIYQRLRDNGDIITKTIEQAYDPVKKMFLPDRFVKGECPRCGCKDQYGDNCEACGATYTPDELKNPVSILSGETPIKKQSEHYFFSLHKYTEMLREWTRAGHLQTQIANKLHEWLKSGLENWDISRDAPYFGFEIPDHPGKYFYVWLDAPVGYMASFDNLSQQRQELSFNDYWGKDSDVELYHFVGKDIVYFHALFWPAMLKGADFRMPTAVFAHGFLTVDGLKMSKSRGTFIKVRTYLNYLQPEYLRYYFAAKLTNGVDDIDLSMDDFMQRVNADLVGKVINIASRCAGFINKKFDGKLSGELANEKLYQVCIAKAETIATLYEQREFGRAMREIMELADRINQYIDEQKPWVLAKEEGKELEVQAVCSMGINLYRILIIYLKPVLPDISAKSERFLNIDPLQWDDLQKPLLSHTINSFKPLLQRIATEQIEAMLVETKAELI